MNLTAYRESAAERERIADLLRLIPGEGDSVLDVGARDGYISKRLAQRFERVVALDLEPPEVEHPQVLCMAGDITHLDVPDGFVQCVLCAEVLEHLPGSGLARACAELSRVASQSIVVGVPYRQDLRLGRTFCAACGRANPPWGHVNAFDEGKLAALFPRWRAAQWSFVGRTREHTNALSTLLMDFAGNPWGTYYQDEPCVHCRASLREPPQRSLAQKVATRAAATLTRLQQRTSRVRPKWVHVLFTRH